jgi:hypothetical protein
VVPSILRIKKWFGLDVLNFQIVDFFGLETYFKLGDFYGRPAD